MQSKGFAARVVLPVVMAAGCNEIDIGSFASTQGAGEPPSLEAPVKTDVITQVTTPEVDVLWVIDNSGSMADEQEKLAVNFPKFMDYFLGSGLDYHIGVTSTDVTGTGLAGKLKSVGTYRYITPSVPNPEEVFSQMARLGAGGSADEMGSCAAFRAIAQPAPDVQAANSGFYRENAALHVIVVSDETDSTYTFGSERPASCNFTQNEFVNFLNSLKPDPTTTVSFSAIVVPPRGFTGGGGCGFGELPSVPYPSLVERVGPKDRDGNAPGRLYSICQEDWSGLLEDIGLLASSLRREVFLTEVPMPGTIEVFIDVPETDESAAVTLEGIDASTLPVDYAPADLDAACVDLGAVGCFAFTYDPSRNAIQLNDYVPPPEAKIRVTYVLRSGAEGDDDFEFGE